jgi:hypothetical protein
MPRIYLTAVPSHVRTEPHYLGTGITGPKLTLFLPTPLGFVVSPLNISQVPGV